MPIATFFSSVWYTGDLALTAQLPADEASTFLIVQNFLPDRYFTAAQQHLDELITKWRSA